MRVLVGCPGFGDCLGDGHLGPEAVPDTGLDLGVFGGQLGV
ncbi:hypothetical protein ACWEKT_15320 [Nocardia takedensis]